MSYHIKHYSNHHYFICYIVDLFATLCFLFEKHLLLCFTFRFFSCLFHLVVAELRSFSGDCTYVSVECEVVIGSDDTGMFPLSRCCD